MRASARAALVSIAVSAGLGLAGCASVDELKDTMSNWFSTRKSLGGGHEGMLPDEVPEASDRSPPGKVLGEEASKSSKNKDKAAKSERPQTAERPKKPPVSVSADAVRPQRADAQSAAQTAPSRLRTLWPEAPAPGSFSR
jgi:hypothetical protein